MTYLIQPGTVQNVAKWRIEYTGKGLTIYNIHGQP